jgi:hypothetical protein
VVNRLKAGNERARGAAHRSPGRVEPRLAWLAAALAFAGAVVLIVVQLSGEKTSPDSTTLGLFVLAVALGFAAIAPSQAIRALKRVSIFKVGGLELGLAEIKRAERVRPPQEADGVWSEPRPRGAGYEDCVERLHDRLERTRKTLGLKVAKNNYVEIARTLYRAELLSDDQETFVRDLLRDRDPVSDDWSAATEAEFLDSTWAFATRFRALVWDRRVRQQLETDHWFIAGFDQDPGHRPDFLAYNKDEDQWILVAPRVGALEEAEPDDMDVPAKRLAFFAAGPPLAGRLIVMSHSTRGKLTEAVTREVREKVRLVSLEEICGKGWSRTLANSAA